MADIAKSVLSRLKNKSKKTGRSNQLCLQLFCQEEFLRRLQQSRYTNNFILKGGLFLYALTDFESRVTVDIDFLMKNTPNTVEKLKSILDEIIITNTGNDFITFEITKMEPITLAKKYAGINTIIIAHIKNTRTTFGIDFGVGDVIIPNHEKHEIPTQLDDFEKPVINTYSIESTVSEKFDAILSLMEYSSRMKDYYDIFYLAQKFDFDGQTLYKAITETFKNRNRDFTIEQFEQLLEFKHDIAMKKKWTAFLKKIRYTETDFSEVLSVIEIFLKDIFIVVISGGDFKKHWDASNKRWIQVS